ncbi:MAG TPA: hypothetical protein VFN35_28435, partial [Ktedonobacteraceae bacterium]|nr:hypothetical protein [Ktedonobacteraceae bacterium]
GVLFELVGVCTDTVYALLGSIVGALFVRNWAFQRIQRSITGYIYIALGIFTAVTGVEKK